ncbi:hypothetical protein MRB53_030308 [Persea americana]|uniref:Uncharacterized protein n=1 Tax=Persea americana TaxID=3435 RepID=A0ACC2KLC7_PERAE|nr:hypothetical protein MRB53_030308 [Persea americana]
MLHGITHTLTSGNITKLANCRRAANNILNMNWAPLDVRPLKAIFDERFPYLECLRDHHSLGPTALFQKKVGERLTCLWAQVEIRCQELNVLVTAPDETLAALSTLRGSIERTHSMIADLERQYEFQQQKFKEQSLKMQAC